MEYAVKVKVRGPGRYAFITPTGHTNRLRVHAARFPDMDEARACVERHGRDNPGLAYSIRPL